MAKKKPSALAQSIFEAHLRQLKNLVDKQGVKGLDKLYQDALNDLEARLYKAGGKKSTTASATELKAMIAQVRAVLRMLQKKKLKHMTDVTKTASTLGARHGLDEFARLEKKFAGTVPVVQLDKAAVFRGLVAGQQPSLMRSYKTSMVRWGMNAAEQIEKQLSIGFMSGKSTHEIIRDVMVATKLPEQLKWQAERIVRTELANAHGATKFKSMQSIDEDLLDEPLLKKLIATFDDRTGDDSKLLHGQAVPLNQPFEWKHKVRGAWVVTPYMHPPNRPNDREVVIPWRASWDASATFERPLTKAQLRADGVTIPPGHKPGRPYA